MADIFLKDHLRLESSCIQVNTVFAVWAFTVLLEKGRISFVLWQVIKNWCQDVCSISTWNFYLNLWWYCLWEWYLAYVLFGNMVFAEVFSLWLNTDFMPSSHKCNDSINKLDIGISVNHTSFTQEDSQHQVTNDMRWINWGSCRAVYVPENFFFLI